MEVAHASSVSNMTTALHHLIIAASDREATTSYLVDLLELAAPWENGFFQSVQLEDSVIINIAAPPGVDIQPQHYAFLVAEDHFDRIRARFERLGVAYTADPQGSKPGEVGTANSDGTGRRLYFLGPDRHMLEVITARYNDVPAASRPG